MTRPKHVQLCEVGPRDGFQFEDKPIPTDLKVRTIDRLMDAGLTRIQMTSFVHPRWVPQMADAEEVAKRVDRRDGVVLSALCLNRRGVERAADAGINVVDLSIATNEQHARDNTNMTIDDALQQAELMLDLVASKGMQAQLGLQTVFGYSRPGDTDLGFIVDVVKRFRDDGLESLSLADSTGMANPNMIRDRLRAVQDAAGNIPIVLHLHDTRGLGLVNVWAALEEGIDRFDTSLGGLGGCPFIPGATGNIATEDTVWLLDSVGIKTGIDIGAVSEATFEVEQFLRKDAPGRIAGLRRARSTS